MARDLRNLFRRVEEFYLTTTGRLSYPVCQSLRDTEYPALVAELKSLSPESIDRGDDPIVARLDEGLANLEAQIERYEALNRKWNLSVRPPELRRRL